MNTRRAYVKMLLMDAPLRGRMQARMTEAKSIETAVAAWNGEEAVLSLIRPTVAQNVAFARSHWPEIESFAREIQALASQMR
jgi:hypothetical protein